MIGGEEEGEEEGQLPETEEEQELEVIRDKKKHVARQRLWRSTGSVFFRHQSWCWCQCWHTTEHNTTHVLVRAESIDCVLYGESGEENGNGNGKRVSSQLWVLSLSG